LGLNFLKLWYKIKLVFQKLSQVLRGLQFEANLGKWFSRCYLQKQNGLEAWLSGKVWSPEFKCHPLPA
jgi:hypothetical protein